MGVGVSACIGVELLPQPSKHTTMHSDSHALTRFPSSPNLPPGPLVVGVLNALTKAEITDSATYVSDAVALARYNSQFNVQSYKEEKEYCVRLDDVKHSSTRDRNS